MISFIKIQNLRVEVVESVFPVFCSLDFSRSLITQLDTIEVQHELVGLQQIFLCNAVFKKTLQQM